MDGRRRAHERLHPCIVDASGRRAGHCRSTNTVRRKPVDAPRRSDRDTVAFLFPPEYPLDSQVPFRPRPPPPDRKSLRDTVDTCRCSGAKTKTYRRTMRGGKETVAGGIRPRKDGATGRWKTWIVGLCLARTCPCRQVRSTEPRGAVRKKRTHGNGGEVYGFESRHIGYQRQKRIL